MVVQLSMCVHQFVFIYITMCLVVGRSSIGLFESVGVFLENAVGPVVGIFVVVVVVVQHQPSSSTACMSCLTLRSDPGRVVQPNIYLLNGIAAAAVESN